MNGVERMWMRTPYPGRAHVFKFHKKWFVSYRGEVNLRATPFYTFAGALAEANRIARKKES